MLAVAEPVPTGPSCVALHEIAFELQVPVLAGLLEVDRTDGKLYNTYERLPALLNGWHSGPPMRRKKSDSMSTSGRSRGFNSSRSPKACACGPASAAAAACRSVSFSENHLHSSPSALAYLIKEPVPAAISPKEMVPP